MAVTLSNEKSALRVYFEVGIDGDGDPILRSKTYSNVKSTATDDEVHALAGIIAGLQILPLAKVTRADQADLEQV